jgi:response regulator RpfG family c-di-GMP phosphodiesterase
MSQAFQTTAHDCSRSETPDCPPQTSILIVDDERGPRESLRMILSGGHRVLTTGDGASALEILRTDRIDLVTVDLNMPGMKGGELIRTVRAELPQVELIIITGCGSIDSAVEGIRHGVFDYLTKPFDVVQVLASVERAMARRQSRGRMISFLESISRILGANRDPQTVLAELDASAGAQQRLRKLLEEPILGSGTGSSRTREPRAIEFLEVLAETIESRDLFMRGHARRVAFYADLLADRLLFSREARDHVRIASFLHDIGKVGAASDLLAGKVMLENERLESIHAHPAIGERLLQPLGLAAPIAITVRHHHERYDGNGYPDRLTGQDIPLAARVITIVDAFDAMTCVRPYRPARTQEEALAELRREARGQFDPTLVEIFCQLIETGAAEALGEAGMLNAPTPDPAAADTTLDNSRGAA